MVSDARSTLQGMYNLISKSVFQPSIICIYVYLRLHSGEVIKYKDIVNNTRLHVNTIYKQITTLETSNLVERTKVGKSFQYNTKNMSSSLVKKLLKSIPTSTLPSSSSRTSTNTNTKTKRLGYDNSRSSRGNVGVDVSDKDWIAARAIIVRHIPESFIDPTRLREKRFMKLCGLLLDESFDLNAYAKWYRVEKFVRLRFNWNIFLLASMIDEYQIVAGDLAESEEHLHTSSKAMKAKHSKAAAKDKEWIRENIMSKVKKNGTKNRSKRTSSKDL